MSDAFGNFADLGSTTGTLLSVNYTVTGSNAYLVVGTNGDNVSDKITGVTYAGVSMAKLGVAQIPGDRFISFWGLLNPASGLNAVAISASSSSFIGAVAAHYTGIGSLDAGGVTNTATALFNITGTITTVLANSWTVCLFANDINTAASAGTNATNRGAGALNSLAIMDSNLDLAPGVHTLQATEGSASDWVSIIISLAPFTGSTTFLDEDAEWTMISQAA